MKGPVYIVKPKNIFKHPFNKFDLDKPMNRESQNDDLTDYFNYGFNEDTMNIYAKLVKRTIEVLDENVNSTYFDSASELMRLNDQIPMDFGGFCKFFDTSIFVNPEGSEQELDYMINYHNGERLFEFFIYIALSKSPNVSQYPLIDFVRCMYKNFLPDQVEMCDVMQQIQQNLQRKYQDTMKKLYQRKNNPGGTSTNPSTGNGTTHQSHKEKKPSQMDGDNHKSQSAQVVKKQEQNRQKVEQSDSESEDSKDSGSSSSQTIKKKKKSKSRKRSESRSRDKKKNKKIKKEDRKDKDRDRKQKERRKQKSKKKSKSKDKDRSRDRDRDRDRDRRKEKSKKRRN